MIVSPEALARIQERERLLEARRRFEAALEAIMSDPHVLAVLRALADR